MKNPLPCDHTAVANDIHPGIDAETILHALPDAVCVLSEDGRFLSLNAATRHLTGYNPDELLGTSLFDLVLPADREGTKQAFAGQRPGCPLRQIANRLVAKGGAVVPVLWFLKQNGTDGFFYGTLRDGHEKQLTEERLRKTQTIARVGNYEYDIVNGHYLYASTSVFEIFGLSQTEHPQLTSELFWRLVHPDDVQRVKASVLESENLHSSVLEYRIVRPDGAVVIINRIREVLFDHAGRPVKAIGTLQDVTEQRLAEQAAVQSEQRYRALVQNSHEMVTVVNKDGQYSFVSANVKSQLGFTAEELVGQTPLALMHPEDVPAVVNAIRNTTPGQTLGIGSFRFRNVQGDWQWRAATVSNQLHNPAIAGYVVNSRDVTEQRKKEEERRQYEENLALHQQMMVEVLEQMQEGFVTITLEGKVIYWNRETERISGVPREEALGKDIWSLYPAAKYDTYFALYKQLLADGGPLLQKLYLPHRNRWVDLRIYRTQKGMSVFFRDVTEAERVQARLRKLSLLVRNTGNMVVIYNKERQVLWVNKAFARTSGYTLKECVGRRLDEICGGPAPDPALVAQVTEKIARNEPYRMEVINYKKNGDTYWADITCQPLASRKGEVTQYFAIGTDVTDRKRLEAQLEQEQKERQVRINAATLMAQERERTAVSQELHDNVNQVLTTVKLYAEMCRDGLGDTREMMAKSIVLLQESITEIRSLSKRLSAPSLGKIRLAESVQELMDAVAATKKLQIELDTAGIAFLELDQEVHLAVYRILQEHITNILKHAGATTAEVKLDFHAGEVLLHVADDGRGFQPGRKSKGIGITNMTTRAESLGGRLCIESAPGKGCRLQVHIPLRPGGEA